MDDTLLEEAQEKTDYTYSHSITYRSEATPDRRVGSPNMSRRGLRTTVGSSCSFNTPGSTNNHSLSLRSRNVIRNDYNDSSDYSEHNSQGTPLFSEETSIQQRLDYGLIEDSDSEAEKLNMTGLSKKHRSPYVRKENGNPTTLVKKINAVNTKSTYLYTNVHDDSPTSQRRQSNFTTYTADDDRPFKVFIKSVSQRTTQFFYTVLIWISTSIVSSIRVIKNPILTAAAFQSWSSHNNNRSWQQRNVHVNTTSQTTVTFVKKYISSVIYNCQNYYKEKRQKSPFLWWWMPFFMLLSLLFLAFRWQYGEVYSEKSALLFSNLKSLKDQYFPNEFPFLFGIPSRVTDCASIIIELVFSIWILLKEIIFICAAAIAPYFVINEKHSVQPIPNLNTNHIQLIVKLMQDTQNAHGASLAKLQNEFKSEKALILAKLEAIDANIAKPFLNEDTLMDLKTKQTSLLIRLGALSASVRSLTSSNGNSGYREMERITSEQLSTLRRNLNDVNEDVMDLKTKIAKLEKSMMNCCNKTYVTAEDMQQHLTLAMSQTLEHFNTSLSEVKDWVSMYFSAKAELDLSIRSALRGYMGDQNNQFVLETLQQTADKVLRESLQKLRSQFDADQLKYKMEMNESASEGSISSKMLAVRDLWNRANIESIVAQMLKKYDADRTGMVDHALESAGGSVVSTRCTENYQPNFSQLVMFGIGIWKYSTNNPRSVIQPSRNPGDCWAFRGSLGYVVIQLTSPVRLTGFTVEHIPKSLSPRDSIDSAPRSFSVYGLHTMNGDGFKLGNYTFLDNSEPLQYFEVQNKNPEFFSVVELKIHSNHGNNIYTCVYRFRVHGVRSKEVD